MKSIKSLTHLPKNTLLLSHPDTAFANGDVSRAILWTAGMRLQDRSRVEAIIVNGDETMASFLARGGTVTKLDPCTSKGFKPQIVRVSGSHANSVCNRMLSVRHAMGSK